MSQIQPEIRGFKTSFTVIGVALVYMASCALVRSVKRQFLDAQRRGKVDGTAR
jgi:hypothetical protein